MITRAQLDPVFRDILEALPVGIVAIASTGQVESWNPAAERILGWSAAAVVGGPPPIELPSSPDGAELELRRRRKDGSLVDLQVRAIPWRMPQEQISVPS